MKLLWLLPLLLLLSADIDRPLPIAPPLIVSQQPLAFFGLSEQRDSLIARGARAWGVPVWLALGIGHAEVWGGDSMAVHPRSGALGLGQIHPVNFGRFPACGDNMVNRQTSVCYMMELLRECIDARNTEGLLRNPTLSAVLACYGGATRRSTRQRYVDDVMHKTKMEWLGVQ